MQRKPKLLISALALSLSLGLASCSSGTGGDSGYQYPSNSSTTNSSTNNTPNLNHTPTQSSDTSSSVNSNNADKSANSAEKNDSSSSSNTADFSPSAADSEQTTSQTTDSQADSPVAEAQAKETKENTESEHDGVAEQPSPQNADATSEGAKEETKDSSEAKKSDKDTDSEKEKTNSDQQQTNSDQQQTTSENPEQAKDSKQSEQSEQSPTIAKTSNEDTTKEDAKNSEDHQESGNAATDESSTPASDPKAPEKAPEKDPVTKPVVPENKPLHIDYTKNSNVDDKAATNASEIYANSTALTNSISPYSENIAANSDFTLKSNFNFLNHAPTDSSQFGKDLDDLIVTAHKYSFAQRQVDLSSSRIKYLHDHNTSISDQSYSSVPSTPYNQYNVISQGFLPLYTGTHIFSKTTVTDHSGLFVKPMLNPGEGKFTGKNINVGIVDSGIADTDITNNFNNKIIKVSNDAGSFVATDTDKTYVDQQDQHGLIVSSIIASKRDQDHIGIAPDTQIYYSTLQYDNENHIEQQQNNLDQIYTHVYEAGHPVAINNSFVLDNLAFFIISTTPTNAASTIRYSIQNQQTIASNLSNALSKFYSGKTADQAPLMVYATGNYDVGNSGLPANILLKKFEINPTSHTRTVPESTLKGLNRDYNYGIGVPKGTYLDLVLQDRNLAKNIIVVSGGIYDPNMNHYWKNYSNNIYPALNTFYAQYGIQEASSSQYELNDKRNQNHDQLRTNSFIDKQLFNSALGAFQCGVVKYDCVTAAYTYAAPNYIQAKDINGTRITHGTSYSTPTVTAVAAMLKEQFPWMSASNLKTTILTTALDVGEPGVDDVFGWGFLNAANAIKGPGMFAFGDFEADLSIRPYGWDKNTHYSTYFVNSIYGNGGLIVSGDSDLDRLYLTGDNKYQGKTIVNGGTLIVTSPANIDLDNSIVNNTNAGLLSPVSVNSNGNFVAKDVTLSSLTNNGKSIIDNVHFTDSLTQTANGLLAVPVDKTTTIDKNLHQDGSLLVFYPSNTYKPTHDHKYTLFTVTDASHIDGKFKQAILVDHQQASSNNDKAKNDTIASLSSYPSFNQIFVKNPESDQTSTATTATTATSATGSSSDSATPQTATTTDGIKLVALKPVVDGNKVVVEIPAYNPAPALQAARVQAASADNFILDQGYQASLSLYDRADKALSLTDSSNLDSSLNQQDQDQLNAIALAAFIQNLTPAQYRNFLYANSGVSFTDLQLATSSNSIQQVTDFSQQVGAKFMTLGQYQQAQQELVKNTNALSYKAYVSYNYDNQDWSLLDSALHGKFINHNNTLGIYSSYLRHSLGVGYSFGKGEWHEDVTTQADPNAPKQQVNLANSQIYSQGIILSYGYALPRVYFNASTSVIYHSYKLQRTSLYALDQTSEFTSWQTIVNGEFGVNLWRGYGQELNLALGTTYSHYFQPALAEQASNQPTADMSKLLSIYSDSHVTNAAQASLGLTYSNNFTLFGFNQNLKLSTTYSHSYLDANFRFTNQLAQNFTKDSSTAYTTAQSFQLDWNVQFKASYNIQFIPSLVIGTDISYQLTKNWHNSAGKVNLIYTF